MSPSEIVFGNRIDLDRGVLVSGWPDDTDKEIDVDITSWADKMQGKQEQLIALAAKVQAQLTAKNIKARLKRKRESLDEKLGKVSEKRKDIGVKSKPEEEAFVVGQLVLVKHLARKSKLEIPWRGPFRIVAIDDGAVDIQDLVTTKVRSVHVSNLTKYLANESMDPKLVAAKDKRQYVVETIVDFKRPAKGKARSNYSFLVKWLGWPVADATWEPYDHVKNNAIFHKFCQENGLEDLIPRQFLGGVN
eukprot:gene15126-10825_t